MPIPLVIIVGPTGSGKTQTAVLTAQALGGEILTADSMQVYRGMDIGTAKPTVEEQQGIPHHLIDVVQPDEEFSVAQYVRLADVHIRDIAARGKVPIVAGGTGFYISALIDRWEFPPQPPDLTIRTRLRLDVETQGEETLHARLHAIDPLTADRLPAHDVKRVIRALEVFELTGKQLSSFDYKRDAPTSATPYTPLRYGLTMPRETLYNRLEQRVHAQLASGLLEEVRGLSAAGYGPELSAMKGITYRQLLGYLREEYDLPSAIELMVRANRRYAKRQFTWFNADKRIHWLDILEGGGPEGASELIVKAWREGIEYS